MLQIHMNSNQNPDYVLFMGGYTTDFIQGLNKPLEGFLLTNQYTGILGSDQNSPNISEGT